MYSNKLHPFDLRTPLGWLDPALPETGWGFAGTAPLLRRASRALAEERNREMTPETHPGGTESGASLVESVMAPCFAPLHLKLESWMDVGW